MRMVADRHRLAANHNKHPWRAFRTYQHRWPWTTWIPKIGVLVNFVLSTDTQQLHITFLITRWRHCAIATVHYGWRTNLLHIRSMAIAQRFKKAEALYFIQK